MKELICIVCPKGCHLKTDGVTVTGNGCPRGRDYAIAELTAPKRTVTSTVRIKGAIHRRCPVKTNKTVDKAKMFDVIKALEAVELTSPVTVGDTVIKDVAGTGADIVCTKSM